MARTIGFAKRFEGVKVWPGKQWDISLFLKETSQEAPHYTQFDERTSWFYEAVGVSVGMMGRTVGFGQVYLESSKDSKDQWLDGSKNYQMHVPPNAPVAQGGMIGMYNEMTYFNGVQETLDMQMAHYDDLGGPECFNHFAAGWAGSRALCTKLLGKERHAMS
jgi:hypothetical protein